MTDPIQPAEATPTTRTDYVVHRWEGVTFHVRRRGKVLSEERVSRILELDVEGLPRVVIAERLGIDVDTVTKYLRLAGRPLMNRGMRALFAKLATAPAHNDNRPAARNALADFCPGLFDGAHNDD